MLGNKRIAHTIHDHLVAGLLLVCMAGIGESAYAQVQATSATVTIEPVDSSFAARVINEAGGTYAFDVVYEFFPTNATFFQRVRRVELGFSGGRLLPPGTALGNDPRVTPTQDYSVSVEGVEQTLTATRPTRPGLTYELPFGSIEFGSGLIMEPLPADRRLTRRIVLTAKDDDVDEGPNTAPGVGNEFIRLVFNPQNPDGMVAAPDVGITYTPFRNPILILDDDTNPPGVTVTPTSLTTTEGGMATFTVVLDTEPAGFEEHQIPRPFPLPDVTGSMVPVFELTNEVRVTVTSTDPSDGGLVSSVGTTPAISTVLTFTDDGGATPWDTPQSVTVNGADNLVSGSDTTYDITFGVDGGTFTPGSEGRVDHDYDGVTVAAVSVTNEDDDGMHGVIVTETGGSTSVAENGGTDTFTVALRSEPANDVILTLTSSDTNEGTVDPPTLTFTPTGGTTPWNTPQTVTLTGVNDNVDRDGDSFTVDFAITDEGGTNYPITPSAPVLTVTATDDDTASTNITLAISPTNVAETADNTQITITATLGGTVVLGTPTTITVTPTGESSFTLTIPALSLSATRTFGIDPVADANTNDETITIRGTASGFSVAGATLTIRDAGLSVFQNASGGMPISLTIGATEGIAHTFYVRLTRAPTGNVVVVPTSRNPTELTINTPSLTFTTANWNLRQAVRVTGVDDDVFRTDSETATATDRIHRVDFAVTTGDGNIYPNDLPLASVDVRVTDDDQVTLVLSAFPTDIPEDAGPTTVTVTAMVMGSTRVSRQIVQSVELQGSGPPVPGTSTQANATLQATGERDAIVTSPTTNCGANCLGFGSVTIPPFGDSSGTITFTIDPLTDSRDEGRERLRVQGDDFGYGVDSVTQAEIFIVESGVLAFEALTGGTSIDAVTIAEASGSDILYVQLASQPAGDVTLSVTSSDTDEGTVNVAALTFTNANWDTRKPVTVTAVNDDIDRDDSFTVDFVITATGDTGNYPTNLSIPSVTVTVTDDDAVGIALFEESTSGAGSTAVTIITTSETAGTGNVATFYVELTSQPTGPVTVTIDGIIATEHTLTAPASGTLTFTPTGGTAWNTRQAITLTGVDDDFVDDDQMYNLTLTPTGGGYDSVTPAIVPITNTDDDTAGLTIADLMVDEDAGTATVTVTLTPAVTAGTVTVDAATMDGTATTAGTDYTAITSQTLTFVAGNTSQTLDIPINDDSIAEGNENFTVVLSNLMPPTGITTVSIADATATVTIIDDDVAVAGLALFEEVDSATGSTMVTSITTGEPDVADTFYVELTSAPTNNVTVAVTSDDTGEGTVSPATLTFTTTNWDDRQLVTVTGANDDLVDGPQNYNVTLNPASTDTAYNALANTTVTATNTDDDTAALALFEEIDSATGSTQVTSITTGEPDVAATFYVELTSAPTANVTVAVTSDDTGEGTVSPATLTFTTTNWDDRQLVTVTGANDDLVDGPQNYNVILNPASTDTAYNALANTTVTATNTDDDVAAAALALFEEIDSATGSTQVTSITTGEPDVAATFYVELTSAPTANVTVAVTSDDTGEGTVSPATLTFTTTNWDDRQLVTVTGANDDLVDGPQNYNVILNPASTDTAYNALANTTVTATNTDDDTAALALFEEIDSATGSTQVTSITTGEPDVAATFYVELTSAPTANVTVAVTSDDTSEGTVSPATLTFTTTNWDDRQLVTVTGANDDLVDGPQNYTVTLNPASTDTAYNALANTTVTATNTDDDTAALALFEEIDSATGSTQVTSITTGEPDVAATFYVELTSAPTANVTVAVTSDDTSEGTVSPATLTFTTTNWDDRQLVTVTGANDDLVDGPQNYNVTLNPASSDTNYNALADSTVTATNTDDDTAALALFEEIDSATGSTQVTSITTGEPDVAATFYVELTSAPTANVTVAVTSDDTGEGTVSPATLTFTTTNWDDRQLVTVTGANDDLVDGPQNYNVILNPASTDTAYNALANTTVTATNTDDDTAALALFEEIDSATGSTQVTSITTGEPDVAATFYVELTSAPTANVTVAVTSDDTSEGTVSPATLTFTTTNWDDRQLVTVTGANDDLVDGPQNYNVTLNPASTDTAYNALANTTVTATNTDDDTAALALFEEIDSATGSTQVTSITTGEPDVAATFYVELTSAPTANVTVAVTSDDTGEGTVSPATLTFTTTNWDDRQLVTVTGANDDLVDGPQNYNVILNPASTDTAYNALANTTVTATNTDDDTAALALFEEIDSATGSTQVTSITTGEPDVAATFYVELTSAPTANVTVAVTSDDTGEGTVSPATLTFTTTNWDDRQLVTVTGANDDLVDGPQNYNVILNPASTDTAYNALANTTVTATNTDDDTAGIALFDAATGTDAPTSITTTEGATTDSFYVALESEPTGTVTVTISGLRAEEHILPPLFGTTLTFTPTGTTAWNTRQEIMLTGVNDDVVDGDQMYNITLTPTGGGYGSVTAPTVSVTNEDNDTADISIADMSVDENAGTATVTVTLSAMVTAGTVEVDATTATITGDTATAGTDYTTITSQTLTFAVGSTSETLNIPINDDSIDEVDETFTVMLDNLMLPAAVTGDVTITDATATVTITDDDTLSDTINLSVSPLTVAETADATTITVTATIDGTVVSPTDTTVTVSVGESGDSAVEGTDYATVADFTLTIPALSSSGTQTFMIDPDEMSANGDTVTIDGTATGFTTINSATLTIVEAGISVHDAMSAGNPISTTTIAEASGTDMLYVQLVSQPAGNVTLSVTSDDTNEGMVTPATLTFSTTNWDTRQALTITAVPDNVDRDGDTFMVDFAVTSGDGGNYANSLTLPSVTVTVTDDDTAALALFEESTSGAGSTAVTAITTTEAGGTATFYVELTSAPTNNVTVAVTSDDTSEGTITTGDSLTFTTGNWNMRQAVIVTGVDDSDVDGDQTYTVTLNPASTDTAYNALANTTVTATNTDDDTAALALFEEIDSATGSTQVTSITTGEPDVAATFYVELTSAPTANVTVAVTSDDTSEGTVSPATLTFTTTNWDDRQLVTVTGANDDLVDGPQNYNVILNPASTDTAYNALANTTVTATNTDDDVAPAAALALFEESTSGAGSTAVTAITTTEAGGTATFYVELTSAPTNNVTVAVTSDDTSEGTITTGDSLTFTTGNWNMRQAVIVTGVDDSDVDGDQTYTVTLNPASTDTAYNALANTTVTATNTDDDTAALALFEEIDSATGSTQVTSITTGEPDVAATFYVELTSAPTANVTVAVTSDDTSEGTVSPATLTFTTGNWNMRQAVIVTGVDDSDVDGDQTYTVTLNPASTDTAYNALANTTVTATNTDDDVAPAAALALFEESTSGAGSTAVTAITTTEAGGTATFYVELTSAPTNNVTVAVTSDDTSEGTITTGDSLTFTTGNWNMRQAVIVTGVDDSDVDGDQTYTVTLNPASSDTNYNALANTTVTATNTDDDVAPAAALALFEESTSGAGSTAVTAITTTEAGGTATFYVELTSAPTNNVTVAVTSDDTSEGTITTGDSLTFTTGNWNMRQAVIVTGVDDSDVDGDQTYTVTLNPASTDTAYNALANTTVTATNTDDDVAPAAALALFEESTSGAGSTAVTAITTTEAGGTATFYVELTSAPTNNVTVAVTSDDTTEGTITTGDSLTFTTGNWNMRQAVIVTGVDDSDVDGDQTYTVTLNPASTDTAYNALANTTVTATNTDDDTAALALFEEIDSATGSTQVTSITTGEPDVAATFYVELTSAPTANVTVAVTSDDTSEGTVSPATLTFTTTNWDDRQLVTVTGANDDLVDGPQNYNVILNPASSDTAYNALANTTVTATNTDDDVAPAAALALFEESTSGAGSTAVTAITTTEAGGTATFYVELTSAPTNNVTVAVTSDDTSEGTITTGDSLTFTTTNWDDRQLVTVTGANDDLVDGPQNYNVTLNPASTDTAYNALANTTVTATNTDDDTAALALFEEIDSATGSTQVTSITTGEPDVAATFYVELTSAPTANVTVAVTSDDTSEGTVSPATLTFTTTNWDDRQLVTVTGANDDLVDGPQNYNVILNPASSDTAYNALANTTVTATNTDDDVAPAAALALFEESTSGAGSTAVTAITTTEAGGTATFYVELTSAPTNNVTVAVTSDDTSEGTITTGDSLTFTTGNWNMRQAVIVTGVDDFDVDGDQTYTVTLNPASSDTNYNALADSTVTATNTDDDVAPAAALALFEESTSGAGSTAVTAITTTEAGGTATFYVELTSAPTNNVTVAVTSDDTSEGTITTGASLTFTTGNWNIRQAVTVTGVDDSDVDGDQTYTVTLNPASSDTDYNALVDTTVAATNIDDETAGIVLFSTASGSTQVTSITTGEPDVTATFYVELTSAPTADVTVAVTSDDTTEGTITTGDSLTFTTGNWNMRQAVIVTGANDDLIDGDQSYTVTLNPASSDTNYNALADSTVDATNSDDDTAGIALFEEVDSATGSTQVTAITTGEPDVAATFYVELTSAPTADVTVAVTSDDTSEGTVSPATLTFTTTNWDDRQLVTVTGADDDLIDGDQSYTITLNPASASDTNYNGLADSTVTATNTDDDVASTTINLSVSPSTVAETADATTITVTATIDGTAVSTTATDVMVTISDGTATVTTDYTATPATLTITIPADAASGMATFMIDPTDDGVSDNDETVMITGTATINGMTATVTSTTLTIIEGLNTEQREVLHTELLGVANQATMQVIVDVLSKRLQPRARTEAHGSVAGHVLGLQEMQAVDWQKRLSLVVYSTLQRLDDGGALLVPVDATTFNNSEFALPLEVGESVVVLWGALGSSTVKGGQSDASDYDGDLIAVLLGIDSMIGEHARLGIAASYEHSELDYQLDMTSGDAVQTMTSIQPYLSWQPYDSVGLWLLGGYGFGDYDATESTAGGTTLRAKDADVERWMAALGFHYVHRFGSSGWDMVLNNKALWNRTVRDATRFDDGSLLPKNISANWRARLESEVGYSWTFGDGSVRPYGLASVRWDGGDVVNDDTTFMVDAGGGVELSFASRLSMDFKVRRQVTDGDHEEHSVVAVGSFGFAEHADGQGWQVALERSLLGGLSAPEHNKAGFDFEQGDSTPTIGQSPSLQANVGYGRLINPLNDAEAGLLKTYTRFYLDPDENKRHAVGLGFDFASLQVGVESEYNNGELETLLRGHIDF